MITKRSNHIPTLTKIESTQTSVVFCRTFCETRPPLVSNHELIAGLLIDLKGAYARRADAKRALRVANYLLTLSPKGHRELRDRGALWERLGRPWLAVDDFRQYLAREPGATDREVVEERIAALEEV
jgi:regulator of sirC expression with transglutaminase-like and TPR domain